MWSDWDVDQGTFNVAVEAALDLVFWGPRAALRWSDLMDLEDAMFYCVSLLRTKCAGLLDHLQSLLTDICFSSYLIHPFLNKILSNIFLNWLNLWLKILFKLFLSKLSI